MLGVTQLSGLGGRYLPPVEVITRAGDVSTTGGLTTQNFSIDIGAAESGKTVFVAVGAEKGSSFTVDSMTVDGVSATAKVQADDGSGQARAEIWVATVNSGGTVTVSVTFSAAPDSVGVHCTVCRNVLSLTAVTPQTNGGTSVTNNTLTVTGVTKPSRGITLGSGFCNNGAQTCAWTGLTERFDDNPTGGSSSSFSAADDTHTAEATGQSVTADFTATGDRCALAVASFR